ncbi:unnamed protein product [Ophioblennius macclurei]
MDGAPVDLSFKNICVLAEAWAQEPRNGLRTLKKNAENKYISCSLRFNNNNLTDLHELPKIASYFLAEPLRLAWLDVSFNKIAHIDETLSELHELRVLYLHGNSIYILAEVDRLGSLPQLHTITLHGNTIETNKAYRNRVISALPRLKSMDFSVVTQDDRLVAQIWRHGLNRRGK